MTDDESPADPRGSLLGHLSLQLTSQGPESGGGLCKGTQHIGAEQDQGPGAWTPVWGPLPEPSPGGLVSTLPSMNKPSWDRPEPQILLRVPELFPPSHLASSLQTCLHPQLSCVDPVFDSLHLMP